ncbi:hypothetical protein BDZ45DRAFT_586589 [Acephala macrosclerotiorum]|nr:hypothetical protein BDZ45DRAFT_586589 [Acephala macrosclerotiorum]
MSSTPLAWYKDNFMISTEQKLLQLDVINKAFDSDIVYWTKGTTPEALKRMLSKSLCFGVYVLPQSSSEIAGKGSPTQIGLGRCVTDEATVFYLTDVFILPEYQGKGLGKWLMECISETMNSWPELRTAFLITSGEHAKKFYKETLGVVPFHTKKAVLDHGLEVLHKWGPGSSFIKEEKSDS